MHTYRSAKRKYGYRLFGLTAVSDIVLPGLRETELSDRSDFTIRLGPVVPRNASAKQLNLTMFADNAAVYFNLPQVAGFVITDEGILCDLSSPAQTQKVSSFLVNYVLPLFMSRFYPVFLGSTLRIDNRVIGLWGRRGSGTSTVAYAAVKNGARLISDEYSVLDLNGGINARCGLCGLWLWKNALAWFGTNYASYDRIRDGIEKYFIPVASTDQAIPAHPIDAVYYLSVDPLGGFATEKIRNVKKISYLMDVLYHQSLSEMQSGKEAVFSNLVKIGRHLDCYLIKRPENLSSVDNILEIIF